MPPSWIKKALRCRAFFCAIWLIGSTSVGLAASCERFTQGKILEVQRIYDGDTLKLVDSRVIRLIGINTPEFGHDGSLDEEGALAAKQRLAEILQASGNRILIKQGKELLDRHKRTLAHIYDLHGRNIVEILLSEGLGYSVYIPPNLTNFECYREAEQAARIRRLGLWRKNGYVLDAEHMTGRETGFVLIRGEVGRVGKSRHALWLNLRNGPSIRIDWSDWHRFDSWQMSDLKGRRLEVRGWIYHRKGQQRMRVQHPAAIQWLDV